MDWIKELVKNLPLDNISDVLARVVFWWVQQVRGIPEESLAQNVYLGGAMAVLALLAMIGWCMPKFLQGVMKLLWVLAASVLLTPAEALGDTGGNAPAIIAVMHHLLLGEADLALEPALRILAMAIALLVIGALWQLLKAQIYAYKNAQQPPNSMPML